MKFIDLYDDFNSSVTFINLNKVFVVVSGGVEFLDKKAIKKGYKFGIRLHFLKDDYVTFFYKDYWFYQENLNRLAEALNLDFEIEDEEKEI